MFLLPLLRGRRGVADASQRNGMTWVSDGTARIGTTEAEDGRPLAARSWRAPSLHRRPSNRYLVDFARTPSLSRNRRIAAIFILRSDGVHRRSARA